MCGCQVCQLVWGTLSQTKPEAAMPKLFCGAGREGGGQQQRQCVEVGQKNAAEKDVCTCALMRHCVCVGGGCQLF